MSGEPRPARRKSTGSRTGNQSCRRSSARTRKRSPSVRSARNAPRSVYSRRCDVSRTDSPVALAEVPRPALLEHGRDVCPAAGPKHARISLEICPLVRNVLHDHGRGDEIEGPVSDRGNGVGRGDDGLDPRKASRDTRQPCGLEIHGVDRALGGDEPSTASARKSGPSPQPRSANASGPAGRNRRSSGGSAVASKWRAVSVYFSITGGHGGYGARPIPSGEGGYDGPAGAVAEWLGRGLQSLVQLRQLFSHPPPELPRPKARTGFEPVYTALQAVA